MYNIKFLSETNSFQPILIKGVPSGYSLLEVAVESDLYLHHNCGMVCSCSSCNLYVQIGAEFLEEITEREREFIDRATCIQENSRLGCQSVLMDGTGYLEVTIPNQEMLG